MKRCLVILLSCFLFSCTNSNNESAPENDLDAARMFIRDALDGKFREARQLMISDTINENRMADTERTYEKMSKDTKRNYRESSITIYDTRKINDSMSIVVYSNTFKNMKDSVKVIRKGGQWLVDLKYTFEKTIAE
ncbi:MAG: hypothetical protein ACJ75F_07805 [Flavisolibacter sp.]|jgi:hypothetical protein